MILEKVFWAFLLFSDDKHLHIQRARERGCPLLPTARRI